MRRSLLLLALSACVPSAQPTTPATPVSPSASAPADDPRVLGTTTLRMPGSIQHVAFFDDAIVAVSQDGTVRFFDRETGDPRREVRLEGEIWGAAQTAEVLLLAWDDGLRLLDLESGATLEDAERPGSLMATADGRRYFAKERTLIVESRGEPQRIELPHRVATVDVARGGRFVAVGIPGAALLFEPGAAEAAHGLAAGANGAIAIDPRDRWVVVEDPAAANVLGVWSLTDGRRIRQIPKSDAVASMLRFSPDGRFLAMVVGDELLVWHTEDWQRTARVEDLAYVRSLTFSGDGSEVAVGGNDNTVRLFASASGAERLAAFGHRGPAETLVWADDGTLYSGGRFDGQVLAWSAEGEGRVLADVGDSLVESLIPMDGGLWALTTHALHPIGVPSRATPVDVPGLGRAGARCGDVICLVTNHGLHHYQGSSIERVVALRDTTEPRFSPSGDRLLSRERGAMTLRRTSDGSVLARFEAPPCLYPSRGTLSADRVAIHERVGRSVESDAAGRVVIHAPGGEELASIALAEPAQALVFVEENVALAGATGVHLWLPGHVPALRTLAVGPVHSLAWNGETLAVGMTDGRIRLIAPQELREAPAVTDTPPELPTGCEGGETYGFGGLGLMGGGGGQGPDRRYFGMFADPHHRP